MGRVGSSQCATALNRRARGRESDHGTSDQTDAVQRELSLCFSGENPSRHSSPARGAANAPASWLAGLIRSAGISREIHGAFPADDSWIPNMISGEFQEAEFAIDGGAEDFFDDCRAAPGDS